MRVSNTRTGTCRRTTKGGAGTGRHHPTHPISLTGTCCEVWCLRFPGGVLERCRASRRGALAALLRQLKLPDDVPRWVLRQVAPSRRAQPPTFAGTSMASGELPID